MAIGREPWRGRLFFTDSPWPEGHRITSLRWWGHFEPDTGVWFDLELTTANYDEDGPPAENASRPWLDFYYENGCYITPADTPHRGFLVGTPSAPLSLDELAGREFVIDPLPRTADQPTSFLAYVSDPGAHDPVADHRIRFVERTGPFEFSLVWFGRVALDHGAPPDFKCAFEARIERATFEGFEGITYSLQQPDIIEQALACLAEPGRFVVVAEGCTRRIVPKIERS